MVNEKVHDKSVHLNQIEQVMKCRYSTKEPEVMICFERFDNKLKFFDQHIKCLGKEVVNTGHEGFITCIQYREDTQTICVGFSDKRLYVY